MALYNNCNDFAGFKHDSQLPQVLAGCPPTASKRFSSVARSFTNNTSINNYCVFKLRHHNILTVLGVFIQNQGTADYRTYKGGANQYST
jgi:hypothetical protein